MTHDELNVIHKDLLSTLKDFANKHGLSDIKTGNMSYNTNGFSIKVEATFAGGESKEMRKLRHSAVLYNFKESICNAEINYAKLNVRVTGMRTTKVILEDVITGSQYLASIKDLQEVCRRHYPELLIS